MRFSLLALLLSTSAFCFAQTLTLEIPAHHYQVDHEIRLIVSHLDDISSYGDLTNFSEVILSLDGSEYGFRELPQSLSFTRSFEVVGTTDQYILYFTELPLISISTQDSILDDPKVHADFVYSDSMQVLQADIGIELRGGFSQSFPKKTYDIEFWEDSTGDENMNVQFAEMRSDDDWVLDALYNEPLRIRSHFASMLWSEMHTPYYQDLEPKAQAGAKTAYAEVFINGSYNGLYDLSEQVDRKLLKLKSFDGTLRGQLVKGVGWEPGTYFSGSPNFNNDSRYWSGYDMKYPKAEELTDWSNVHAFLDFVVNSSDHDFKDSIWHKFNYDNYLDYFIFLNLLRASDNTGKNIYLARYDVDEPYFNTPWDLDGCFGTLWNGTYDNFSEGILRNGMIDRVIALDPSDYQATVSTRWFNYRSSFLDEQKLEAAIEEQFNYFERNRQYERERLVFPNYSFERQELKYILNWINRRLTYLDAYFGSSSTYNDKPNIENNLTLYPNPTTDHIHFNNLDFISGRPYKILNSLGIMVDRGYVDVDYINVEKLESGMYILLVNGQTARFKVY